MRAYFGDELRVQPPQCMTPCCKSLKLYENTTKFNAISPQNHKPSPPNILWLCPWFKHWSGHRVITVEQVLRTHIALPFGIDVKNVDPKNKKCVFMKK